MKKINIRVVLVLSVTTLFVMMGAFSLEARAQSPTVDPAATKALSKMTDYLGSLKAFSVHTQNTLEDYLISGHRVDLNVAADVIVSRPDKLLAERLGDLIDQAFYYDGRTLTLYNPSENVYAAVPVPGTIEEMFDVARESLGLIIPVADLVYRNAYPLLMQDVTLAMVVGKSFINGVKCDHLLFSRPGVDFQVWVADNGHPLPYKYIVTDTGNPARLSVSTVMNDWDTTPSVDNARFTFVPPKEAKTISFMPF